MNKSENIGDLAAALAKAQGEMRGSKKDAANPFFKSNYSTLASCFDAIREPLSKNGLSIVQTTVGDSLETITIETTLMHASGQWVSSSFTGKPVKSDPQGMGSALSYFRRYSLSAMVGIAPVDEDDDGNHATGLKEEKYQKGDEPIQPNRDLKSGADSIVISQPQRNRLFAIMKKNKVSEFSMKNYMKKFGLESTKDIQRKDYDAIIGMVESGELSDKEGVQHEPEELRV